jgi:hypothetical protein
MWPILSSHQRSFIASSSAHEDTGCDLLGRTDSRHGVWLRDRISLTHEQLIPHMFSCQLGLIRHAHAIKCGVMRASARKVRATIWSSASCLIKRQGKVYQESRFRPYIACILLIILWPAYLSSQEVRSFFCHTLRYLAILQSLIVRRASYLQLNPAVFAIEVALLATKTRRLHHHTTDIV